MPGSADLIRRRRHREARRARSSLQKSRRGTILVFTVISLVFGLAAIGTAVVYSDLTRNLPSLNSLPVMLHPETGLLTSPTVITDRSGEVVLAELGAGVGYLPTEFSGLPQVSPELLDAFIAATDPGFWDHPGFYRTTLLQGKRDTIPLKLVSELLFWQEPEGPRRIIREGLMAAQVIAEFGREQVFEWYLNSANFGYEAFGLEAAARLYFGKSAGRLTLAEAAMLAAVAQAPDLNPFDTPELALARRDQTLRQMLDLGMISQEETESAVTSPPGIRSAPDEPIDKYAAFVNLVRSQVARTIPLEVLARGGLTIVSTLDVDLQTELYCTAETQLFRLGEGSAYLPEDCRAARFLPSLPASEMQTGAFSAEGVVLDPRSGQILALVSIDSEKGPAPSTGTHQPGSILTPYVYLTALTRGFSPGSLVWDIPAALTAGQAGSPNLDGKFHGPMRLRSALAGDYLVPALKLLSQFVPGSVWRTAALSGLPSLAGESAPLLLNGGALSLVEITHAYGALSTQGVVIGYADPTVLLDPTPLRPTAVIQVFDRGGRTWLDEGPPQARPVMSAPLAYALTNMLSDETARWAALGHPNVLEVGRPAGVKMGYTQDLSSVWTVGFTPQLALGIWLGEDRDGLQETGPLGAENGLKFDPRAAAGVWHAVLKFAASGFPPDGWTMPQGVSEIDVCDPSGELPTPDCPVVVREIFLQGNEPVHTDTLYKRIEINRETGLLATVFTPPSLIEARVFFVPPPEALSWAQQAGLDIPPENYDLVSRPPSPDPEASLMFPEMFAYVSGEIRIRGSAEGPGFQSYSVQVGQGLNPQRWLQLGDVSDTPVSGGELAVWDTSGLNGLYAVRLLVVRENNLVATHIVQVTVDNQPPELAVLYPLDGQSFAYPQESTITLQLSVTDNLLVQRVNVLLDGRLVRSLAQPPYALSLSLQPGEHELRVVAEDQAGNRTIVEQTVIVER